MKLQIESNSLKEVLGMLAKIPYASNTPINAAFFVEIKNETIRVSVRDEVIAIEKITHIPDMKAEEGGRFIVNSYNLNELVQKLHGTIHLQIVDTKVIKVEAEGSRACLNLLDIEHWRDVNKAKAPQPITLTAHQFKQIQNQISPAAQGGKDARPVFQGINLRTTNKQLTAIATDGSRIAWRALGKTDQTLDVILPLRTVYEINRLINENKVDTLQAHFHQEKAMFELGPDLTITSHLIHETFPDVEPQLQRSVETKIICNKKDILAAAQRTSVIFDKSSLPRTVLEITKTKLCIATPEDNEMGHFQEAITPQEVVGPPQKLVVQAKFLLDALKTIDDSRVILAFLADKGPLKIYADSNPSPVHLIMPFWSY